MTSLGETARCCPLQLTLHHRAILAIFCTKTAVLVIFQPFPNQGGRAEKKSPTVPLRVLLVSTRPSYFFPFFLSKLDPPEARQKFLLPGLLFVLSVRYRCFAFQ